jgi:hypothetical protein
MNSDYEELYRVRLLDDLHNFFPAILYEPTRFQTVPQLLQYISTRTRDHFNLFNRGQSQYRAARNVLSPLVSEFRAPVFQPATVPTPRTPANTGINLGVDLVTETIDLTPYLSSSFADTASAIRSLLGLARAPAGAMDPVSVAPTEQQIAAATTIQDVDEEAHNDLICSVCQEGYTTGQLIRKLNHCNHRFHKSCIDPWFRSHVHCPVCRHDIRETVTQPSTSSQ